MTFNDMNKIKKAGFSGFKTIKDLFMDNSSIPAIKGVYFVLYLAKKEPEFLEVGSGPDLYKKKVDPNVSIEKLKSNWVEDTIVIYIGKAGGRNQKGIEGEATLRSRLKTLLCFGQGNDVRHYGGRYIWQLKNSRDLVVCWKPTPGQEPREIETGLIKEFVNQQKQRRPFANHQN